MTIYNDKLSEHFSLSEFTKTSQSKFQKLNEAYGIKHRPQLETMADFMEKVRKVCGCPILITSGIRCPELNQAVGGATNSQHVFGSACDFIPQSNGTIEDHFGKIFNSNLIYDQLILERPKQYNVWLHISYNSMLGRREALIFDGKHYKKYTGN